MLAETSIQAQFLIPMAISLGFGILFASSVIVFLVPACLVIVDDGSRMASVAYRKLTTVLA